MAADKCVSRRQAGSLREPAAAVSARQHLVFLCGELRNKRTEIRTGQTRAERSRRTRSGIEGQRFAARSAREVGGIITRIFAVPRFRAFNKHAFARSLRFAERVAVFTRTRNRYAQEAVWKNRRATVCVF